MLQRVQSIYLFLASLAIFALYLFPLAHNVGGMPMSLMITGSYIVANGHQTMQDHFVALSAVTAIVGLIPLVIIFLFKNRKQQITLCYSAIFVIIGFSFWMAQTAKGSLGEVTLEPSNFGIGLFLCPLAILFIVLAFKAIQRDEKLIKSADRLR